MHVVEFVRKLLEREGHECVMCLDPLDALAKLKADRSIVVVITDWHMPGFSGLEVLEVVRQERPDVRRVLLTAAPQEPEVREAVREGLVQALVAKPFGRVDVRHALRGL